MRPVIYTVIIGAYEPLLPPRVIDLGADYVCLCDVRMPEVPPWEIRVVECGGLSAQRESRRFKILSHCYFPDAEYTLYQDGNVQLKVVFPYQWLEKHDIATCSHPNTDSAYDEAERCLRLDKGDPQVIKAQMDRYRTEGFPEHAGAVGNSVILRRHTDAIVRFNELWWEEIQKGSVRDQISFNYVSWKLGIGYDGIPWGGAWDNDCFDYTLPRWHVSPIEGKWRREDEGACSGSD